VENEIISISSLSSTGEGIGSMGGLKVFVDGALPGERVSIEITEQKKTYAKARLRALISPSLHRAKPLCPVFGKCGGCQLMHLQYPIQLEVKRKRVTDALERIGGIEGADVASCIPSPLSLGYRNKIQLPVIWENGIKSLGLYRKQSHEVIPLKQCLIQCAQGEEILALITEKLTISSIRYVLIRNAVFNEEAMVIFVSNGQFSKELKKFGEELLQANSMIKGVVENLNQSSGNTILGPTFRLLAGRPYIYERLLQKTFKISPSAFFQVNPEQSEKLYETAIAFAEIASNEIVLDAYCGVGALAILSSDKAKKIYGIESVPQAVADAIENARLNHRKNCSFRCGKAEKLIVEHKKIDTLFLNPPRTGCASEFLKTVIANRPRKIVYISCDPATLARDLSALKKHYSIKTIQPFDMFPQTMHVETIVRLTSR
jgi:23S rRNA (uracil1939-C5)-methyltransferase